MRPTLERAVVLGNLAGVLLGVSIGPRTVSAAESWLPHRLTIGQLAIRRPDGQRLDAQPIELARDPDAIRLRAGTIVTRDVAGVATHQPLRLDLRLSEGEAFGLTGTIANATGEFRLRLDLPGGASALRVELDPLRFQPGAFQPSTLLPGIAMPITDVAGEVRARGSIPLTAPADGTLSIDLSDASLDWSGLRLAGITSAIQLARLAPLATAGPQTAVIEQASLGALAGNGTIIWSASDGQFRIEQVTFAGEQLSLIIDKTDYTAETGQTGGTMQLEHLDLERLVELLAVDGLIASGRLSGRLPFALEDGAALAITGGALQSDGPGIIRYAPASAPAALAGDNPGLVLARQALENFHYTSLGVTIDGRSDDRMQIGVQLAGSNPDLYGGHPIEFNLNLDGALALLAQRILDVRALPDALSRRVLDLLD